MKKDVIHYVDWFRNSTSYINAHRGKVFVFLLPGEAVAHENFRNIVYDLSLLNSLGVKLVIVHGARQQISEELRRQSIEYQYHKDLRITTPRVLDVIKQIVGSLGIEIESRFSLGLVNSPMHGADMRFCRGNFIVARPLGVHDGVDFQNTGLVRKVRTDEIQKQLSLGNIVLVSNLGYSSTGEVFNLSAEEIATETAIALKSEKLIFFVPGPGITNAEGDLVSAITPELIDDYVKTADPEDLETVALNHSLQAARKACNNKVNRIHLISHQQNGALIQELFTPQGTGTLISDNSMEHLRQASVKDVGGILALIKPMEQEGILVERSRELLETEVENFAVVEFEGMLIACAALYPFEDQSGEIACIAIHPEYRGKGHGSELLAALENNARSQGLKNIFILTTAATHWFLENGFTNSSVDALPESKKQLYNYQRNSKVLIKAL